MLEPYRMVFVNMLASLLLIGGALIYRYIYPKKKINLLVLLLLICILPIISVFRAGDYESGDFNIHIYRIMSFFDSLKEGHLMPSWAGELNATYGNPLFIFNYPLPYYVVSLFHFIGISFISSLKMYLGLTLYFSGIFMYFWVKELTGNKLAAFASAIFYTFAPYHLIDVHFRATPGESTIFLLAPLLFLFITKYSGKNKFIYLIWITFFTYLMFLAHPVLALVFFGISILYILFINFRSKKFKPMLLQLVSVFVGFIFSMYAWTSFIIYAPYMLKFPGSTIPTTSQFYPFIEIIFSPWRYGLLFQGPKGELAQIIGYAQIFILLVSIAAIIFRKIARKIRGDYVFWIFACIFFIFMMHPLSLFIWQHIDMQLFNMMIPYGRFMLAISFCTSLIAGYFVLSFSGSKIKKRLIYVLLAFTIASTILNWGQRRVIPEVNDSVLRKNVWNSSITDGPTYFVDTKWADKNNLWFSRIPSASLEITKGNATITQIKKTSTEHTYLIDAKTPITIKENTLYFPGWVLKSNNKNIAIYPGTRGVITGMLTQGKQKIELTYSDIMPYALTKTISFVSFLSLTFAIVFYYLFELIMKKDIYSGRVKKFISKASSRD